MKEKTRIRRLITVLKRPRYFIPLLLLIVLVGVAGAKLSSSKKSTEITQVVRRGTVAQEVNATGTVKPVQVVDLGFEIGGRLTTLGVKVGDTVKAGTVLASLQNGDQVANLKSAQAKLSELLKGSRAEDLAVTSSNVSAAQTSLLQASQILSEKITDSFVKADDAVRNHADKLYGTAPTSAALSASFGVTVFSGGKIRTVTETDETVRQRLGSERNAVETILDTWNTRVTSDSALDAQAQTALKNLQTVQNLLNDVGLSVNNLSSTDSAANDLYASYKSDISSARATVSAALFDLRSAIQGYASAQSALDLAQKQQVLKQAPPTPEAVQIQQAVVDSAQAAYAKTVIVAPFDGLITKVVPEKGEIVGAGSNVISIISASNLEIEVNIPEADIPKVRLGDEASVTFDAYGKDYVATSTVVLIDPAATVIEGVPTYRTTLTFGSTDDRIRSGMTANITVHGERRDNVIEVPQRAVVTKNNGKFVNVVRAGKIVAVPVTTGLRGSDGNIEIINGLQEGESFIPSPTAL